MRQTEGPHRASNEPVDSQPRHLTPAFAVSVAVHAAALAAILFLLSHTREEKPNNLTRLDPVKLVWIPDPRPAGRGGGGAPPKPTPPPPTPTPAVSAPEPPKPVIIEEPRTIAPEPEPMVTVARLPQKWAAPHAGRPRHLIVRWIVQGVNT